MRAMPLYLLVAVAVSACDGGQPPDARTASVSDPSSSPGCTPGKTARVKTSKALGTIEVESRCPESEPFPIGASRKLILGTVLAELPCRWWPDFAGSWWQVVEPYPKHLAHIGHSYLPGRMTLVSEDRARFTAKAIELHLGKPDDPPTRLPAQGDLELNFQRVEGPVPQGGCA